MTEKDELTEKNELEKPDVNLQNESPEVTTQIPEVTHTEINISNDIPSGSEEVLVPDENHTPDESNTPAKESATASVLKTESHDEENNEDAEDLHHTTEISASDEEDIPEEEDNIDYDILSKTELVEAIEKAVSVKAIEKVKRRIGLIKLAFIKINKEEKEHKLNAFLAEEGNKKEDYKPEPDPLEERFNAAFKIYKKNKKAFEDALTKERDANLNKKKLILDEIKKLIDSDEELKHTYDAFKKLQIEWKETGQVPPSETNNLWQSYHFLVEKFLDKVRINEELRDLDKRKNLEQCIDLCEKAEELLLNPSINESYKLLQKFHDEWKEIGPLPSDKKEEVWERFRQASIKVNERRREYFEKVKSERENNLETKTALCENIEELVKISYKTNKEWQTATDKVLEIQNLWKTLGPVPNEQKDQIWKRFRDAINLFFDSKKEHFEGIKEEYLNNYNLKLDICNQAENIKLSTDWKNATNKLIKLQNDWKQIGPLPKKQSDELWRKFRTACDYFFEKKQYYFANIDEKEKENLQLKLSLIEKVKDLNPESDFKTVFETIKEYQREFTVIGHVPMAEKEKINNLFRDAVNAKLDEMKVNPLEKKMISYKSKFESIKSENPYSDVIKNEIRFISNKITQINTDIQLWENNIGFFANSKNANILKKEFENKIEKAKEELKVLEEKIKFLKTK